MNSLNKYIQIKKRVEEARQKASKAEGALEQVMQRLKSEFSCPTLEVAKKRLKTLERKEETIKDRFDEAVEAFEDNWPEALE